MGLMRMKKLSPMVNRFSSRHPIICVIGLIMVWLMAMIVLMGVASTIFNLPYGSALPATLSRLIVTLGVISLLWRLNWLKEAGIARLGNRQTWLVALMGLLYFTSFSLFAFYGKFMFNFSHLWRSSAAQETVIVHGFAGLGEEIMVRGLILYVLVRVWGRTRGGLFAGVLLTAVLFSIIHLTQVLTNELSPMSAILLMIETLIVSFWWGAIVVSGGSIWPAVILHWLGNAVIVVQGLTTAMIEPQVLAYERLIWFALPLSVVGTGLIFKAPLYLEPTVERT